jgi:hypothetical protein
MADGVTQIDADPPYDEYDLDPSMSRGDVMNWLVGRLKLKRTRSVEVFLRKRTVGKKRVAYFNVRVWKEDV